MSAETLRRAFASTATALATVSSDQMDEQTPCASWTVRELVNHIVGGTTFFAVVAESGEAPPVAEDSDFCAGDFNDAFAEGARRAVAAFSAEGAMERVMRPGFGDVPGSLYVNVASLDTFTHGWDLAKATGQSTDLDPGLATRLLGIARESLPDAFRGADGEAPFGLRIEVPETACPADQLAGFMGRQP
jgi:uncharacterized protein (TIGR03086 family)